MRSEDPNNETDVAADVTTDVAADVTDVASAIRNAVDSMAEDPRNAEDSSYRCYDVTKDKHSRWTQRLGRCQRSCDYNEPGCFGKEGYCEVDMGECLLPSYSTTDPTLLLSNPNICKNALLLPCGVYSGKHIVGGNGDPCPLKFKGYYCNFEKQTSYGCGVGLRSVCWKSYTSYGTVGWCVVAAAGACTYDTRCRVATWLPCEGQKIKKGQKQSISHSAKKWSLFF